MLPPEGQFVAASHSRGSEDFIKQLEKFSLSKDMSKPTYKVIQRMSDGKPCYSCFIKVSAEHRFLHKTKVEVLHVL
jgi:hypothetical protein